MPVAPRAQPVAGRAVPGQARGGGVRRLRWAVHRPGGPVAGVEGEVDEPRVGGGAVHDERLIAGGLAVRRGGPRQAPFVDAPHALALGPPVLGQPRAVQRRRAPGGEQVEGGVGGAGVGLVGHGRVDPVAQHPCAAGVGADERETVGGDQAGGRQVGRIAGGGVGDARRLGLFLVEGGERAAAAEPEQHDGVEAEFLAHPAHAGAQVGDGALHDQRRLVLDVPRVHGHDRQSGRGERAHQEVRQEVRRRMRHEHAHTARGARTAHQVAVQDRVVPGEARVHLDGAVLGRAEGDALQVILRIRGRGGGGAGRRHAHAMVL